MMPDMHEYTTDSLYFYQGNSTGTVRIKYQDGIPTQVGCRKVISKSQSYRLATKRLDNHLLLL